MLLEVLCLFCPNLLKVSFQHLIDLPTKLNAHKMYEKMPFVSLENYKNFRK